MERQTNENGRIDRRKGDPRIGRLEGAGKGKPRSYASISAGAPPAAQVGLAPWRRSDQKFFNQ